MNLTPTHYFLKLENGLFRAARVQLPEAYSGPAEVRVETDGSRLKVQREFQSGQALIPISQRYETSLQARVTVVTPSGTWSAEARIPATRQWTIYVTQDKHLDYGWIHPVEGVVERINTLTDFALDHSLRWTFESSLWVEEYIKARPAARAQKVMARLRDGKFEAAANWLVPSPGLLSIEETARLLLHARGLKAEGVNIQTALMEEAPSLPWGLATLLAEARLPYLIKGAYDLRNPHLKERDPFPLFLWEGPDGSQVLLRWDLYTDTHRWGGYAEAYSLWRSENRAEKMEYIEQTIARYQSYPRYPYPTILLVGTGFDEFPQTTAVADFIQWYNNQEWAFPRLVEGTWKEFWQQLESQMDRSELPVLRGDWGTAWEEWPAQIARLTIRYRQARALAHSAQALNALVSRLEPATQPARVQYLAQAWRGLLQFSEHDFGGISPDLAEDVYETKAGYAHHALRESKRALESGISTLAAQIPRADDGQRLVVANPNNWQRDGLVEVVMPSAGGYEVIDLASGERLPAQVETRGPGWLQHYLAFDARDVPGFGYRSYQIRSRGESTLLGEAAPSEPSYQNAHYRLALNPQTGGVRSLVERMTGRELVTQGEGEGHDWSLFEYLRHSEGKLLRSQLVSTHLRKGALCDHWIIESTNLRSRLRTTYKLYHATPRLEVAHELYQDPSSEPQANWFALPFSQRERQYAYDGAAAILRPGLQTQGGDLIPGAALSSYAAQSFLAVEDRMGATILASPDAYLFQFGEQVLQDPSADSDPHAPLALSLVLHNLTRNDFLLRQGGQEYFTFRYSLTYMPGGLRPSRAVQFAAQAAQDLPRALATGAKYIDRPAGGAFVSVNPENLVVSALKTAEDGKGWVLRVWECDGRETTALLDLSGLRATHAWSCDLLEDNPKSIPFKNSQATVTIPAYGVKTFRFE